jgi:hypothetical protein
MSVRYMYRCSAAAWILAFGYYGSGVKIAKVVGAKSQAVYDARTESRMPAHWAALLHKDSKGKVDAKITRPDLYAGIL